MPNISGYLYKHTLLKFISVVSLSLCFLATILVSLIINKLTNFDNHYNNSDKIYVIEEGDNERPPRLGNTYHLADLIQENPNIESISRAIIGKEFEVKIGNNYTNISVNIVDSSYFSIFSHEMRFGNPHTAFDNYDAIILSRNTSEMIFGQTDPIGKNVVLNDSITRVVTGVFETFKNPSFFSFDAILPLKWHYNNDLNFRKAAKGQNSFVPTFLLLKDKLKISSVEHQINKIVAKHYSNHERKPFIRLLLFKNIIKEYNPAYVYLITGLWFTLGCLVIISVCNLATLNTALVLKNLKNLAIKKILGQSIHSSNKQHFFKCLTLVLFSVVLALLCVPIIIGVVNASLPSGIIMNFDFSKDYPVFIGLVVIVFFITILSTFFPIKLINKIPVRQALKGELTTQLSVKTLRKTLIIFQLCVAIVFTYVTIGIAGQVEHLKNQELGFNAKGVYLYKIPTRSHGLTNNYSIIKGLNLKLNSLNFVKSTSILKSVPGDFETNFTTYQSANGSIKTVYARSVSGIDNNFFSTFEISILAGKQFSRVQNYGREREIIINEKAAKDFGWSAEDAVNKELRLITSDSTIYKIIGVASNYKYDAFSENVEPLVHISAGETAFRLNYKYLAVNVSEENLYNASQLINSTFSSISENHTLERTTAIDVFNEQYKRRTVLFNVLAAISIIAIFIASTGSLILVTEIIESKKKDIAIRKVMGAHPFNLALSLSTEFSRMILLSILISVPTGYLILNFWFQNYSTPHGIQVFGAFITTIIAGFFFSIGVIWRSVQAVNASPLLHISKNS